jgi:hypothetical protein
MARVYTGDGDTKGQHNEKIREHIIGALAGILQVNPCRTAWLGLASLLVAIASGVRPRSTLAPRSNCTTSWTAHRCDMVPQERRVDHCSKEVLLEYAGADRYLPGGVGRVDPEGGHVWRRRHPQAYRQVPAGVPARCSVRVTVHIDQAGCQALNGVPMAKEMILEAIPEFDFAFYKSLRE